MAKVFVGTSGFSYDAWYGSFYPEDLPKTKMLSYYAKHFDTCEINNTFYRLPTEALVTGWTEKVPDQFSFVLKASQKITHLKRLKDVDEAVSIFLRAHAKLGPRTGPVLVQLPPNMKKDLPRLNAFLAIVPPSIKIAMEFGNPAWFADDVYDALRARDAAVVAVDAEEKELAYVPTASFGYVRLRRVQYSRPDLVRWAAKIKESKFSASSYVFFKHEDEGTGPRLGKLFREILDENG